MFTYFPMFARILRSMLLPRYARWRFFLFHLFLIPAILLFRALVMLFQGLDYLLFPGFRKQVVEKPIFILSNPRSGSTFLHRLLEKDEQFTYIKLWHTLLPSVTLYKLVHLLTAIDRWIGRPLYRLVQLINYLSFGGWDGVHAAGLDKSEEDELLFVYLFLTPGIMIFFPFMHRLDEVKNLDAFPPRQREKIRRYFRRCMQRHVYATGGKTLLAKNALAAGRLGIYRDAFPDMRVVNLYRHPAETVPSALSMFTKPWRFHSPHLVGATPESHWIKDMILDSYTQMLEHKQHFDSAAFYEIGYRELVSDPQRCVESVYEHYDLELTPAFSKQLADDCERARGYRSKHEYDLAEWGLSDDAICESAQSILHAYPF